MKKIIGFVFTAVTFFSVNAQNSKKAEDLLKKVSTTLESYKNIQIKFNHSLINNIVGISQSSKGDAILQDEKYVLHYLDNTILYDDKATYIISPENEEVNITKGGNEEDALSPSKILYFYKTGYSYIWDETKNVNGKQIQYVKLLPNKTSEEVSHVMLAVDTKTNHIHSLTEVGTNGTNTTFEITEFVTDQDLNKDLFKFDKKKYEDLGYYINQ